MKKTFTLLCALALGSLAFAQDLTFKVNGQVVKAGETVVSSKLNENYTAFGGIVFEPNVTVECDEDVESVFIKGECKERKPFQMCFGGDCVSNVTVEKTSGLYKDEPIDLQIEAGLDNMLEPVKTYTVDFTAINLDNDSEPFTFTLIMSNDPAVTAGVGQVQTSNKVGIHGNVLDYAFDNAAARTLTVYTTSGATVFSQAVESQKGAIALPLRPGAYIYQVTGAGKALRGKAVIR